MNNNLPKVSIVLPTYNGAQYIAQSIESCLNQTYKNIELIIVDDHSSDKTPEIISAYEDIRITHSRHNKNRGLPYALNTGFALARGEYFAWTSDDNQYLPTAIEEMVETLEMNQAVDLVYADYWVCDLGTGDKTIKKLPDKPDLGKANEVGPCFLFRRQVYEKIGGYDPKYSLVEDYEYWIRLWKIFNFLHYPRAIYLYGVHSNSLTSTKTLTVFLLDRLLKYQHKYLTLRQLGKSYIDYFIKLIGLPNMKKTRVCSIFLGDSLKVFRISFPLGLFYCLLISYHLILRSARRLVHLQS